MRSGKNLHRDGDAARVDRRRERETQSGLIDEYLARGEFIPAAAP